MRRRIFLAIFFPLFTLYSQEIPVIEELGQALGPFPLTLVLEGAKSAGMGFWRPDWPLELPPDAFKLQAGSGEGREISGCRIEGGGFSLNYRLDAEGRVEEFPFFLANKMAQVSLVYAGLSEISEIEQMLISFPSGETPLKLEFLEYKNSFPFLIRGSCADIWYFIYFTWGVNEILESWYDEQGYALAAYSYSLAETGNSQKIRKTYDFYNPNLVTSFFYDSREFLTEILDPGGQYKVLFFREELPRYWERRPFSMGYDETQGGIGNFYLQWDEGHFLLRIRGLEDADPFVDYRYEYDLDRQGNWIERRETRMIRDFGLLVPSPGNTLSRILEYRE